MKTRYNRDPKPMEARFQSTCSKCRGVILFKDQIIYWPSIKKATHLECGAEDYRNFLASVQDETIYNGGSL